MVLKVKIAPGFKPFYSQQCNDLYKHQLENILSERYDQEF